MKIFQFLSALTLVLALPLTAYAAGYGYGSGSRSSSGGTSGYGYTNPQSHSVRGYTRRDGTYVAPHRSTNPNSTGRDNYSTRGNTNPWTGESGSQYVDK